MKISLKTKQFIQFSLFLSLGIFFLWFSTISLSPADLQKVKDLVFQADLSYILPCVVALVFSHYVRALRWKMMMDELDNEPKPGLINVFLAVLTGYFLNLLFPRLGEVAKCSLLGKYEKMKVDKLIGTIVAERIIDLICLILVITITIFSQFDRVGLYAKELFDKIMAKTNDSLAVTLSVFLLTTLLIFLSYKVFKKTSWVKVLIIFFTGIKEGLFSIAKIQNKLQFTLYTVLIWFLYLLSIRIGFYSMTDTITLSWVPSLTVLTFGSFAMIATQGGIGAYQLAVQKTLTLYQINEITGLAFGWLMWSVQTFMLLFVGPLSIIAMFLLNRWKKKIDN